MGWSEFGSLPRESKLVLALVCGGEFVNHMYLVILPPILGILAGEFEVSLALLGVAIGVQGLTNAVFQVPFGYVSDNYSRTLVFTLAIGLGTLGVFITALAPSYAVLLVGQAVLGLGVAGHHPSHYPLIANVSPTDLRARAFSIRGFTGSIGFGAAPLVITVILGLGFSWRYAVVGLGLLGGAYGLAATVLFGLYVDRDVKLPEPRTGAGDQGTPAERRPLPDRFREEIAALVASPPILAVALLTMLTSMVGWGINSYTVVYLTESYGVGIGVANLTLSAMFVVGALFFLVGGDLSDRVSAGSVLLGGFAVLGVLLLVFATSLIPTLLAIGIVVGLGCMRSITSPAREKLIDAFSGRAELGRSFAIMTVGMMAGGTIAPPLFGYIGDTAGLPVAFLGLAFVTFVALLLSVAILQRYVVRTRSLRELATVSLDSEP